MPIELSLDDGGGAASDSSTAETETSSAGVIESVEAEEPSPAAIETTETEEPDEAEALPDPADAKSELSEDDIEKLLKDPNTPKEWRDRVNGAWAVANKHKTKLGEVQSEFDNYKSQYEGREVLAPDEVNRLKSTEDTWLKLTSFTATPDDVLGTIKEANPRVYGELLTKAAWDALEKPDGSPDFDNLQAVVDKFSAQYGETKVSAKDVLQAIQGMASGQIEPADLQVFGTPEEMEAWQRTRTREAEISARDADTKAKNEYAEKQIRSQFVSREHAGIQQRFSEPVLKALGTFELNPIEGEPKVAADFKAGLREEIGRYVTQLAGSSSHLGEVDNILSKLNNPGGLNPQAIESEIQAVLNSPGYKLRLDKGLSEIQSKVEKFINQRALQYKYMMKGYEIEAGKTPRKIPGKPNQQTNGQVEGLTEEQLSRMTSTERKDYYARQMTQEIRSQTAGIPIG
jgi:hypothetical protein